MIVEDDLLVADMLELTLIKAGFTVCGIARTVPEAVACGEQHQPDLAIIDVQLAKGGIGTDILPQLRGDLPRLGVLYVTGNAGPRLTATDGNAWLGKPYTDGDVVRALKLVEQLVGTGAATPPFPVRFHLLGSHPAASSSLPGGPSHG
jgi:CheY-like chemotaxis protein